MSDSTISIKVADGSYRRVIERGFSGRKKLTVTTVRDNQEKVQIDLYRGNGGGLDDEPRYIGSLVVENIPPAPQGEPEIELSIGITRQGELSAEASDRKTGESQKFSTTLTTLAEGEVAEVPEFEVESGAVSAEPDFEERPLTGESYRVSSEDRRKEVVKGSGPNLVLLFVFVLLGVLLVAAIAYFIYRSVRGPEVPPLTIRGTSTEVTPQQPSQPAQPSGSQTSGSQAQAGTSQSTAGSTQPSAGSGQPAAGQSQTPAGGGQTSVKGAGGEAKVVAKGGVTYRIKRGDTLWDISATYYRNPWLYRKLARANSIRNPDLIFAGTRIYIPEN